MSAEMRRTCCSSIDRFSSLPNELIGNILARVPLCEAAKTSILSRRWRFIWRLIPDIIFDDSFCKEYTVNNEGKLMRTISDVLLFHTGPIRKFHLSLSNLISFDDVDRVIYPVLTRGIKNFCYSRFYSQYPLPPSLFMCEQLEHLSLSSCLIILPTGFRGLPKLVSLELYDVAINSKVCSTLISGCPLLERLTLQGLNLTDQIEIVAPNLKLFQYRGTFSCIWFKATPRLESISITSCKDTGGEALKPDVLYDSLPALQYLELHDASFKYIVAVLPGGKSHNGFVSELNHLKVIKLYEISFGNKDDVSTVFSLIRNSQNLEEFTIQIGVDSNRFLRFLEIRDLPAMTFDRLRKVKMVNVTGRKEELFFIEYILANAPKLLKMVIMPPSRELRPFDLFKDFRILAEVTQFRRESRLAQITFGKQVQNRIND